MASTYPRWTDDPEPNFVHALSKRLAQTYEVHVLCPHAPGALREETLEGVWVHRFRYAPNRLERLVQNGGIINNLKHHRWKWLLVPPFFIGLAWQTWRLNRRLRPVCLHAHWIVPQGLIAACLVMVQRNPAPFLLTSHGGDLFSLRGRAFEWLKRVAIRRASAITVVSQAMTDEAFRLGAASGRVHVMPMGVDFDGLFAAGSPEQRQAGEILFVGRLVEKKGLRYLIEAMPAIVARVPHAHLRIVGHGPEEPRLRDLAAQLCMAKHIEFVGSLPQTEIPRLYRQASVFVAPFIEAADGDREGLGLVTVEAIACGCPVIVGDMAVLDDILEETEADLRINPKNIGTLAGRVADILCDPMPALARTLEIRSRLEGRLSWKNIENRYRSLLEMLHKK